MPVECVGDVRAPGPQLSLRELATRIIVFARDKRERILEEIGIVKNIINRSTELYLDRFGSVATQNHFHEIESFIIKVVTKDLQSPFVYNIAYLSEVGKRDDVVVMATVRDCLEHVKYSVKQKSNCLCQLARELSDLRGSVKDLSPGVLLCQKDGDELMLQRAVLEEASLARVQTDVKAFTREAALLIDELDIHLKQRVIIERRLNYSSLCSLVGIYLSDFQCYHRAAKAISSHIDVFLTPLGDYLESYLDRIDLLEELVYNSSFNLGHLLRIRNAFERAANAERELRRLAPTNIGLFYYPFLCRVNSAFCRIFPKIMQFIQGTAKTKKSGQVVAKRKVCGAKKIANKKARDLKNVPNIADIQSSNR